MRWSLSALVLVVVAQLVSSTATTPERASGSGWTLVSEQVDPTSLIPITVLLKTNNVDLLRSRIDAVSTPGSKDFGKYLTRDEVTEIVKPPMASQRAVSLWLHSLGASDLQMTPNQDVVSAFAPLSTVESALGVKLCRFERGQKSIVRACDGVSRGVPASLKSHVAVVLGLWDFAPKMERRGATIKSREIDSVETGTPGAPSISKVKGGDYLIHVTFYPGCMSGNLSIAVPPCADYPPQLSTVIITAYNDYRSHSIEVAPTCTKAAEDYTSCTADVGVYEYEPLTVTVQEKFSNGVKGPVTAYDWLSVNAPAVNPYTVSEMYSLNPNVVISNPEVSQAVVEFEDQWYSPDDLALFMGQYEKPTDLTVSVVGNNFDKLPGVEAQLDIQWLMGVAPGPTTFWSNPANGTTEIDDILAWAIAMNALSDPPVVNSVSYGMAAANVDIYLGEGYLQRSEDELMKLASRGISILIASGDTGAGDLGTPPMSVETCYPLHYDWPSCSAYITSVGATFFTPYAEAKCYKSPSEGGVDCLKYPIGEVGVSLDIGLLWTSGGGFANDSRPDFQATEVATYLSHSELNFPPPAYWNSVGRAYPDVSAVGHNMVVAHKGSWIQVDGTSASAPVFSGVISLLNNDLLAMGLPRLGFLNPVLYQVFEEHPEAFYDVTVGSNRCGAYDTDPACCDYGYEACESWDAVAGMGTPMYDALLSAVVEVISK
ncbi:peptidase C53 family protein [Pelomyxa schiedti]|nr:peptidase C53 family protein [Pelomyxa schiedti]